MDGHWAHLSTVFTLSRGGRAAPVGIVATCCFEGAKDP